MAGAWLDALLVAALVACLAWLYRPEWPWPRSARSGSGAVVSRLGRFKIAYLRLLRQAGFDAATWLLWVAKLSLAVLLPVSLINAPAATSARFGGWWPVAAALVGFFLPDLVLLGLRRRRGRRVARALPYFLDLLVALLHSGLSVVDAFRRAGREGFAGAHPLAREVALVGRELDVGERPSVAFRKMAERTGVPELNAVAAALRLGVRLGATVQATLRIQAETLWVKRREDALKQIHRAEIQVMFPVMLSGFPIFIVLSMFPILMDLADALASFGMMFQ